MGRNDRIDLDDWWGGFNGSDFVRVFVKRYPTVTVHVLDALTYAGDPDNLPPWVLDRPDFHLWYGDTSTRDICVDGVCTHPRKDRCTRGGPDRLGPVTNFPGKPEAMGLVTLVESKQLTVGTSDERLRRPNSLQERVL